MNSDSSKSDAPFVQPSWLVTAWLGEEKGLALLIALIALALFSLLGFYMALDATTELRISDNYESNVRARYAARAGLNHARELLRGLQFGDLLQGPDGTYDSRDSYLAQARSYSFRSPFTWSTARSMDILDPSGKVRSLVDDGLFNTGSYGSNSGQVLIPATGIAQTVADPYGSGKITISWYFVKVTDNNGEASEVAHDATDDPFVDGDGTILVRSMGIAPTIRETIGSIVRTNSVSVFEGRFRRRVTFNMNVPLVILGGTILPSNAGMFMGNNFHIVGGAMSPGIGTIDADVSDGIFPAQQISGHLLPEQRDLVQGLGLTPSIRDLTALVSSDPEMALLLDPTFLWNFVDRSLPAFADSVFLDDQVWSGTNPPDIGYYDIFQSPNNPLQNPKVTLVEGNLAIGGDVQGGGLLVVRGKLSGSGLFTFNGLVLVIGTGELDTSGMNMRVFGGLYIVNLIESTGGVYFGTPRLTVSGITEFVVNRDAIETAVRLIPVVQLGWREVTSTMDP